MAIGSPKASGAFRTIGEVSDDTGIPQHILRYWETRFPQLKPLTRAGNRRYYRPQDIALIRRIDGLLNREGYTVRGVQQVLAGTTSPVHPAVVTTPMPGSPAPIRADGDLIDALRRIRETLAQALVEDIG